MKKLLTSFLCSLTLLTLTCLPADARIVIGIVKSTPTQEINQLSTVLSEIAAEDVQIRQFDNEAALTNWLVRFQEVDTAIVTADYLHKQPAGTLQHLADIHLKSTSTPLSVVSLHNLPGSKVETIQKSLFSLAKLTSGQKALAASNVTSFTLPGEKPTLIIVKPEPAPEPPEPVTAKKPEPAPAVKRQPQKPEVEAPVKAEEPALKPVLPEKKTVTKKQPTTVNDRDVTPAEQPVIKAEPEKPVTKVEEPIKTESEKPVIEEPAVKKPVEMRPTQPVQPQPAKAPLSKRLILFIVLIILVAILLKVTLLVMRWQSRQRAIRKSSPPPPAESIRQTVPTAPVIKETEAAKPVAPLVVESGFLGPGKVPALLKRCADLPQPVVLKVSKGSCEKLIYFAAGQIAGAMTHNAKVQESGTRWNKLGSMLLREEFITREERDQAMALLTREPNLRFGEALLKLGYITLAELRHALTRQAKITIYSLILFPEGKYDVYADDGSLPAEESVSLEVTNLIREASHHQSEWLAIREALPNLNTALNYTPEGQNKLAQVNLSAQQQDILSLVNGKTTINELSANSSMMDYEVYRFLYMMVKAGVLK